MAAADQGVASGVADRRVQPQPSSNGNGAGQPLLEVNNLVMHFPLTRGIIFQRKEKLEPIRGLPPDLIDLPDMCPFVPRCNYAREKCEQKNPPLLEVNSGHWAACWFWEEVSKESDQDLVAQRYGHPEPSSTEDYSFQTVIPGSSGVIDPNNPLIPSAPPNIDTNSSV